MSTLERLRALLARDFQLARSALVPEATLIEVWVVVVIAALSVVTVALTT